MCHTGTRLAPSPTDFHQDQREATLRPNFVEALLAVGKARLEAKRYSDAIALLERAVKLQPRSEPAHYSLMMAYRNSGDMEAAKREKQALDTLQKRPKASSPNS